MGYRLWGMGYGYITKRQIIKPTAEYTSKRYIYNP